MNYSKPNQAIPSKNSGFYRHNSSKTEYTQKENTLFFKY